MSDVNEVILKCDANVKVPKRRLLQSSYHHDVYDFHIGTDLWIANYRSSTKLGMTFGTDERAPRASIRLSADQVKSLIDALSKCAKADDEDAARG